MNRKAYTLFISFLILLLGNANTHAQVFCPSNLDFEQGSLSNWYFYTGSCCPINTATLSGPVNNRHTLTSGAAVDTYGKFPIVAPGGGVYSLKLGNNIIGAQAERARYYIKVPPGNGKHILIYRYAVVFEDPGHLPSQQPRFEVKAFDSATNSPITCNQHTYISSDSLPGFFKSTVNNQVFYKPWTTSTINLTGYNGKTVAIDFASGDCHLTGHFGYGYVDMNCGLFQIFGAKCDSSANITLSGPPGFQSYKWMDSALTTVIGTTKSITIPTPLTPVKFAVIVTPYSGFGCTDTLYTTYAIVYDNMQANISPDTAKCGNNSVQLQVSSDNPHTPFQYYWWPAAGLSCTNCSNPYSGVGTTTTYYNYIENQYGCRDTNKVVVTIKPAPEVFAGNDTVYCNTNSVTLMGLGTGGSVYTWKPATTITNANQPMTTATVPGTTTFTLVLADTISGCSDTDKVTIKTNFINANAGTGTAVCKGTPVKLFGAGGASYNWSPAANLSSPTAQSPTFYADTTTLFTLTATSILGCKDTDTVLITVKPSPGADAGPDTGACAGTAIKLNGTGNGTYKWMPPLGLNNPVIPDPTVTVTGNVTYQLIVTDPDNCTDTDEVNIVAYPTPVSNAGNDTLVCFHAQLLLNADSVDGSYRWFPDTGLSNPAIKNPVAFIVKPVNYYLEVVSNHGCRDTDMISITMMPPPVFEAGGDTTVCNSDTVQLYASGGDMYYWHADHNISANNSPNPLVWPSESQDYIVTITDTYCDLSDTLHVGVGVHPREQLRVVATPIVCGGELSGQLTAYGGKGYQWIPADYLSDPNSGITKANPPVSTLYTLTAINGYGCPDTVSALLEVHGDDGIYTPNAFTPNGDGLNDCYRVIVTGNITTFEMYIYNRWGQPVFHTTEYAKCWDGIFKGERAEAGTYYYFYKAVSPLCGNIFRKGDISLIR